ncbi:pimeloyl-ACP methyl ester carboxylesterase [Alkalibacillus flavidus]|uniref:Pimeloyl-ACP methyl ester carboxylesterase n=1 Tax=Alkalibacillus flavidus TaxID=546021 RepID=A0ABV2KYD5_9BACI
MAYLERDGCALHYRIQGDGEAILFIHCPIFPSAVFKGQVEALKHNYQVIENDLRGHGRSRSNGEFWNFTDIAKDLCCLIERKVQRPVWIVAYSAGCSIAFELSLMAPHLVKGMVQIGAVDRVNTFVLSTLVKAGMTVTASEVSEMIAIFGTFSNTRLPLIAWPLLREALKTNATDAYYFYRAYLHYDVTKKLSSIDQPIVLLYGEKDKLLSRYGRSIASRVPNCWIRMIRYGRHQLPGNQTQAVNQEIHQFIQQQLSL